MMSILNSIIQTILSTAIYLLIMFILVNKILREKKKKELPLKKVKTVVFDMANVKEDLTQSAIGFYQKRTYYNVLEGLKSIAESKTVKRVILDVDKLNFPLAKWEEINELFDEIRKDKEVVAIGTIMTEGKYRYALLADKVFMLDTKQSNICFRGYEYKDAYWKSFLAKFGIRMNVLHIGDYKAAGENFSLNKMSKEKKESIVNIKEKLFENFVKLVESKRGVNIENEILNGDFIFADANKAKQFKLIDGVADYEEIGINYKEDTVPFEKYITLTKNKKNRAKDTIAVMNLEGVIELKSTKKSSITYKNVCEKLEELDEIKNLKGLVLRINSPGGSALESEKIYKKLKKLGVPIYISMGDVCASGGYYIATVGKKLFADSMTLTGSIGVVMMYPEIEETVKKLDINVESIEKGKGFDMLNPFGKLGEDSKEKLIFFMKQTYAEFKEHVMAARGIDDEELEKIAQGRVWLGSEAKENNLIDEIGSLDKTVRTLAKDLKLEKYKIQNIELEKTMKETIFDIKPSLISEEIEEKISFVKNNMNQILYYENDFGVNDL